MVDLISKLKQTEVILGIIGIVGHQILFRTYYKLVKERHEKEPHNKQYKDEFKMISMGTILISTLSWLSLTYGLIIPWLYTKVWITLSFWLIWIIITLIRSFKVWSLFQKNDVKG